MPINALDTIDKIATETDLAPAPAERKKRIPRRIAEVVNLLVSGECQTIKAAAKRIGMHPNYVSTALRRPEIRVFIAQRVRHNLAAGTMRAGAKMLELIDSDSQRVAFEASRCVLGIDGIRAAEPTNVSVNIDMRAGYVIDLRTDTEIRRGVTIDGALPAAPASEEP